MAGKQKNKHAVVANEDWTESADWDLIYRLDVGKDPKTGKYLPGKRPPNGEPDSVSVEEFFGFPPFNSHL